MTLRGLAVHHPYYASQSNYYSNEAAKSYETWEEFYKEWGNSAVHLNLVYRWDIAEKNEDNGYENDDYGHGTFYMELFIIQQRKGIYTPIHIDELKEGDVPQIMSFLQRHYIELMKMWDPFLTISL